MKVIRDDGKEAPLRADSFFRGKTNFTAIEKMALQLCGMRVLDIGAGSGLHSLALRDLGRRVTSIDISEEAVCIMKARGLDDVRCTDVFQFIGGPFDTLIMLGHGIGMVETLEGLDRFLNHAIPLLKINGRLLLDSLDVRASNDPDNLAYHEANRKAGRYVGEVKMRFEFQNSSGPFCGWLQVDPDTLIEHACPAGWSCEILHSEPTGDYLAQLCRREES